MKRKNDHTTNNTDNKRGKVFHDLEARMQNIQHSSDEETDNEMENILQKSGGGKAVAMDATPNGSDEDATPNGSDEDATPNGSDEDATSNGSNDSEMANIFNNLNKMSLTAKEPTNSGEGDRGHQSADKMFGSKPVKGSVAKLVEKERMETKDESRPQTIHTEDSATGMNGDRVDSHLSTTTPTTVAVAAPTYANGAFISFGNKSADTVGTEVNALSNMPPLSQITHGTASSAAPSNERKK